MNLLNNRFVLVPDREPRGGGMATVHEAIELQTARRVAVKVFNSPDVKSDILAEAFKRELGSLKDLRHPNIVEFIDSGRDERNGCRFIVLEWLDQDLSKVLSDRTRNRDLFDWATFWNTVGSPILNALSVFHSRSMVHRDVKPANILISSEGTAKLSDFGISKIKHWLQPGLTLKDYFTPVYSPPVGVVGGSDYSRDVFSFGVLVVEALCGHKPASHDVLGTLLSEARLPADIRQILERCISLDPSEWPQTANVLLSEINSIQAKASQIAARTTVHLQVIPSAVDKFRNEYGCESQDDAERRMFNDLNDDPAVAIPIKEAGQQNSDLAFEFLGGQFRYFVRRDRDHSERLLIVSLQRARPAALERAKDNAFRANIVIRQGRPTSAAIGNQTIAYLESGIAAKNAKLQADSEEEHYARLFTSWKGILKAKSKLEHERRRHIRYRSVESSGRGRAVFDLIDRVGDELVGQTRSVELPRGRVFEGQIESVESGKLTMVLTRGSFASLPREGALVVDTYADQESIRRQQIALDAVAFRQSVRPDLGDLLTTPSRSRTASSIETVTPIQSDLDDEKRRLVEIALATPDFLAIEGPPGTGKTTLIAEITLQYLAKHPEARVLITSQTRVALDHAAAKIHGLRRDIRMTRVGRAGDGQAADQVSHLRMDPQMAQWRKEAIASGRRFLAAWANRNDVSEADVEIAVTVQSLAQSRRRIEMLHSEIASIQKLLLESAEQSKVTGVDRSEEAAYLRHELDEYVVERDRVESDIELYAATLERNREYYSLADASPDVLEEWLPIFLPSLSAASTFAGLLKLHAEWNQRFGGDKSFEAILVQKSQVIAGTCLGMAAVPGADDVEYDLCILDEASKATPTEALVPLSRARKWILVGDPNQLPPFKDELCNDSGLREQFELTMDDVSESMFDRLLRHLPAASVSRLTLQHRMSPAIGDLISSCFYGNTLRSAPRADDRDLLSVLPRPVTWYTTAQAELRREARSSNSFTNVAESNVIRQFLNALQFYSNTRERAWSVAVVAGYSAQKTLLERMVDENRDKWANLSIEVNTIDAIQGREADIAVYSLTRSNDSERIGFLRAKERLNVALSRARHGLLIVGDHTFVRGLRSQTPIADVLAYIEQHPDTCVLEELR